MLIFKHFFKIFPGIGFLVIGVIIANERTVEPELKDWNWQMLWLENNINSNVNIELLNGHTVYDSLMTITYGYQLSIPGLLTSYIYFTDNQKTQYQLSNINKAFINNKYYSGKKLSFFQAFFTSIPYLLVFGVVYTI